MNDKNCEPAQGEAGKPMTKEMVAEFMSIAPRTVESWVQQGILPKPTVIGRRAYWHPQAIHTWLNSRLPAPVAPTLAIGDADPALHGPPASPKAKKPGRPRSALPACVAAKRSKSRRTK